jgi:hypothetical protein
MDPTSVIATTSISSIIVEALLKRAFIFMLQARKTDMALVTLRGKTELCKRLYSLIDANFQCVDVDGETMASLSESSRSSLEALERSGATAQRDRLFNLYAKAYVTAIKTSFKKSQFLFVTSSYYIARFVCNVHVDRIRAAVPSKMFGEQISRDMSPLKKAEFESRKVEAVRTIKNTKLIVFDSWEMLTYEVIKEYKLSPRL